MNRGLTTPSASSWKKLFGHRDLSAIDRAWAADYVEHSTLAGPGLDGLRAATSSLPAGFRHERVRVLAEDELVVVHGLYHGLASSTATGSSSTTLRSPTA